MADTVARNRKTIGIDYLRNNTASVLDDIKFYDQSFLVTRGGAPVGLMVPAAHDHPEAVQVTSERLRIATGSVADVVADGVPVIVTRHRNRQPVAVILPIARKI